MWFRDELSTRLAACRTSRCFQFLVVAWLAFLRSLTDAPVTATPGHGKLVNRDPKRPDYCG